MSPELLSWIGNIISAVLGFGIKYVVDLRKQKNEYNLTANEQAFLFYKNLVETLQKQIQDLIKDASKVEGEYVSTREVNAELKSEIKHLKEKIDYLQQKILKCTCNLSQ